MGHSRMRRRLLQVATGASILGSLPSDTHAADIIGEVPCRRLGHIGEMVSMIRLGGFHLVRSELPEAEIIRIVRAAIDNGLSFLDNCCDYNGGQARSGSARRSAIRKLLPDRRIAPQAR
jgi:hypothetical protein